MHFSLTPFVQYVSLILFFFINLNVGSNCISFIYASRNDASSKPYSVEW